MLPKNIETLQKISSKGVSTSKCDVGNWKIHMYDIFKILGRPPKFEKKSLFSFKLYLLVFSIFQLVRQPVEAFVESIPRGGTGRLKKVKEKWEIFFKMFVPFSEYMKFSPKSSS